MNTLVEYINERLIINKKYVDPTILQEKNDILFKNLINEFNSCYKMYFPIVMNVSPDELIYSEFMQPVINICVYSNSFTGDFFDEFDEKYNIISNCDYLTVVDDVDDNSICFSMVVDTKEKINGDIKNMKKWLKYLIDNYDITNHSVSFGFFLPDESNCQNTDEYFKSKEIGQEVIDDLRKIFKRDMLISSFNWCDIYKIEYNSSNFNKFGKYYTSK